mmetsp:Transcript_43229/g.48946  ORF Transcript_43229/g.48946 Transcript_43229/m.48946 type:complete len:312 (+) Transcript_43229:56-991(+)
MISTAVTTLFPVTVLFTLSLSSLMLLQGVFGGNTFIDPSHVVHHLTRRHLRNRVPENIDEWGREKIGGLVDGNLDRSSAPTTTATTTDISSSPSDTNTNDDAILSSFLQNSGTINELEVVEMPNIDTEEDLREEEDSTFTSTAIISENNKTPTTTTNSKNITTLFIYVASALVAVVVLVSVIACGLFVGLRYRNRRDRIDAKKMKQKPLAGPDTSDDRYKYNENGSVYENNTTFDDSENTDTDTDPGIVRNHRGVVSRLVCSSAHSCTRQQQQYVAKNNNTDPNNDDTNDEERKQNNNNQLPAAYQETVVL